MVEYKPYEKYKDTGIEWIGQVPEHWEAVPLKSIADKSKYSFVDGPFGSNLKNEEYQSYGVPLIQLNNISEGEHLLDTVNYVSEEKALQLFRHIAYPGEIVIAKMAHPVARATKVSKAYDKYIIVADCIKLTPDKELINSSYLVFSMNSLFFRVQAERIASGTTRLRVNLGGVKNLRTLFPPLQEQQIIANFLDHKTSEIDNLIHDKEKLITLLQEYRQSVISEAVTKGLNPDVKMKDSGIEWIGEIPEHWETLRLKYAANLVNEKATADDLDKPYIGLENIQSWTGLYSLSEDADSDEGTTSNLFAPGMVLFGKLRPYLAKCVKVNFSGRCSTEMLTLKPNKVRSDYLHYLLLTDSFISEVDSSTYGAKMPRANWSIISNLKIAIPPQPEQDEITDYLDRKTSEIDTLISGIQGSIEQLKAYRQSLISEAVTGKIDVREFAAEGGAASG
ncbi:MAG: restriction endonuclease subunit S [Bacillota bacterium]|jgi:type I restriction enzyme S subunit